MATMRTIRGNYHIQRRRGWETFLLHGLHALRLQLLCVCVVLVPSAAAADVALVTPIVGGDGWSAGHATFYGNADGSGLDGGACGYGPTLSQYGPYLTAISVSLYQSGLACGGCFEVKCVDSPHCNAGKVVKVTAVDECPEGGYCVTGKMHFDLSQPAFQTIGNQQAGVIPILWRRAQCERNGAIQLHVQGGPYWLSILVKNTGGDGGVKSVQVKPSDKNEWYQMTHVWGQMWDLAGPMMPLKGPLSIKLISLYSGQASTGWNCIPQQWQSGQTYSISQQFGQAVPHTLFNSGRSRKLLSESRTLE